jgi:hypothetical protein
MALTNERVVCATQDELDGSVTIGYPGADGPEPIGDLRTARAKPLSFEDRFICWEPNLGSHFEVVKLGDMKFDDLAGAAMWYANHCAPSLIGQAIELLYHRDECDQAAPVGTLCDDVREILGSDRRNGPTRVSVPSGPRCLLEAATGVCP